MTLPSNNLWVHQVANELGEYGIGLPGSTHDIAVLCRSSKINKWSKWKPIQAPEVTLNQALFDGYKWGLSIPVYNSPQALYAAIAGNVDLINYNRPTATWRCRLDDFRNYDHGAPIPTGTGVKETDFIIINKGGDTAATSFVMMQSIGDSYRVGYDDLKGIAGFAPNENFYVCAVVKVGSSFFFTSSDDNALIVWKNNATLKYFTGNAEIFLCYSTVNYNNVIMQSVLDFKEKFIPIPINSNNINPYMVQLTNNLPDGSLGNYYVLPEITNYPDMDTVIYSVKFGADMIGYSGTTLTNIYLRLYDDDPVANPQAVLIALTKLADSYVLAQGTAKTYSGNMAYLDSGNIDSVYFAVTENGIVKSSGQTMEDV